MTITGRFADHTIQSTTREDIVAEIKEFRESTIPFSVDDKTFCVKQDDSMVSGREIMLLAGHSYDTHDLWFERRDEYKVFQLLADFEVDVADCSNFETCPKGDTPEGIDQFADHFPDLYAKYIAYRDHLQAVRQDALTSTNTA